MPAPATKWIWIATLWALLAASARAADPLTPAEELYQYTSDPSLWPSLAANPALYPELVTWLASTGDPHVLAVLRSRGAI